MPRIAILGGGISGLTAAYELEQQRRRNPAVDWHLFEASDRLGGTIQTTRLQTPEGEYILEDGPDGWVTEKPWARDLAEELGLGPELIPCNEAERRTYIWLGNQLVPMPPRMRLIVPEDLDALNNSPLFSEAAKRAYADELTRAAELKATAPTHDESVATFTLRHFGPEVLTKVAAPLLAGVFGGDVHKLSVRAVMPQFVQMERDHGSLIAALQAKARNRPVNATPQPTFTSLRRGMASLVDALTAHLPLERVHLHQMAHEVGFEPDTGRWYLGFEAPEERPLLSRLTRANPECDYLIVATSLDTARSLLSYVDPNGTAFNRSRLSVLSLTPTDASSAILTAITWSPELAQTFTVPPGFGFLAPPAQDSSDPPQLLACTFVDQKFPHRAPAGTRILRAFFGSNSAEHLAQTADTEVAARALAQLCRILGPLPNPTHTTVARWPRSLPQYEVGHLDRMHQLDEVLSRVPRLHLLGNSYHGVGIPDLIRDARQTARRLAESLT